MVTAESRSLEEPILEPEMPIIDAHHHLLFYTDAALQRAEAAPPTAFSAITPVLRRHRRYLLEEFLKDTGSGHNVIATVHVDARTMYRATGPERRRSAGEVEFINGMAAMAASGLFGPTQVGAAIVGGVDLKIGAAAEEELAAHVAAAPGRYRGVRTSVWYDGDPTILGGLNRPHILADPTFREGFAKLRQFGLSFDANLLEPQLPELVDLAEAFPDVPIAINHLGGLVGVGRHAGRRAERFEVWRESMRRLAGCGNVFVKLGGLGVPFGGFTSFLADPPATSRQLADEWRPYAHTAIELFGARRCMFESNFPIDASVGAYPVIWNAFKRLATGASKDEKAWLFAGAASAFYRLEPVDTV